MIIRKFKPNDIESVARIIKKTFLEYNRSEGSKKSVDKYVMRYEKDRLPELARMLENDKIIFVAAEKDKVIGVVRGNDHRVFQLFVEGKYHGKGIGRRLMQALGSRAKELHSRYINLRSSLYAVRFYQHLGYKKTTGIRTSERFGDIRYQPMKKELK